MERVTKADKMAQRIIAHGETLRRMFPATADEDPIALCKRLCLLEGQANRGAVRLCNGEIEQDDWERMSARFLARLETILEFIAAGIPCFINGDPRGYALKIDCEWSGVADSGIHRDWGGYGIIAPDLRES